MNKYKTNKTIQKLILEQEIVFQIYEKLVLLLIVLNFWQDQLWHEIKIITNKMQFMCLPCLF